MQPRDVMYVCPPPTPERLRMDRPLAVGFGMVTVYLDGVAMWDGDDETVTVAMAEEWATNNPGHWRIRFLAALSDATYQRFGPEDWQLVDRGEGFA